MILRKLITMMVTVLIVMVITFLVFEILPGNSAVIRAGTNATEAQIEAMEIEMGLHRPVIIRFGSWILGLFKGDLGESWSFDRPVMSLILGRFTVTLGLTIYTMVLAVLISIPIGLYTGLNRHNNKGFFAGLTTQVGMAIPSFWLGLMMVLFFGLALRLFTPGRFTPFTRNPLLWFYQMLFPALALAIPRIAVLVRYLHSAIGEQYESSYVTTARSKGVKEKSILKEHILKNSLIPMLTVLGILIAEIIGGSIIVENIFNLPGLGRLLITAISSRDFPLIQGMVLFISISVIVTHTILDIIYGKIDPRIGGSHD